MPIMRPYTASDLPEVLQFLGECFRDGTDYHHPGDILHWMSSGYRGTGLERHFWLYEERGKLVAFAELPEGAWTSYTLIIHPQYRGDKSALLAECQGVMQKRMEGNPPGKRTLSTSVTALDHERMEHLTDLGYCIKPSDHVVAIRSLSALMLTPILPTGFHMRSVAGEHEAGLVADVHSGAFGSSWTPEEYLSVMRTPGFNLERELAVVAPEGRFAAFLIYWLDPVSKTGLFEPVGCHEDFRRSGLSKALMVKAMKRMVDAGMERAVVGYSSDNVAAGKLYASVGFKKQVKTFDCEVRLDGERG